MIINSKYIPSLFLQGHIKNYFIFEMEASSNDDYHLVVPDGCIEINFNLQSPLTRKDQAGKINTQADSYIISRFSQRYYLHNNGPVRMIGIRFYPWGIRSFIQCSVNEIMDRFLSLDEIFGSKIKSLHENISNTSNPEEAIFIIEKFLMNELYQPDKDDVLVADASRRILLSGGQISMDDLRNGYGISQRRMQQRFNQSIGINPTFFKRLIKFQKTLLLMSIEKGKLDSKTDLTDLCYQSGYYDQSHFIREFKCFSGMLPKQYLAGDFLLNNIVNDIQI